MKVAFGENPKSVHNEKSQSPTTRMATAALLREIMFKTQRYIEEWQNYYANPEEYDKPDYDFKLESLIPVLKGDLPVKIHAHRADDIFTAIRIGKEFNLKITIEHCTEGHLIVEELKKENIPLMLGPSLTDRSKIELKELSFKTPGILSRAGIDVAIITDHPATPIQYLPFYAALAVKHGMDPYEALKSITINAAKNCFIDDRIGSIKAGKDADIVIFDKNPLDIMSNVLHVIIDGKTIYEGAT
jgi:imidazolonepropionase-like amidohydrolase